MDENYLKVSGEVDRRLLRKQLKRDPMTSSSKKTYTIVDIPSSNKYYVQTTREDGMRRSKGVV